MPLYAVASASSVTRCADGPHRSPHGLLPGWPWHAADVPFEESSRRDGEVVPALCGAPALVLFGHVQWRGPGAAHGCPECWSEAHRRGAWGAVSVLHTEVQTAPR